VSGDDDEWVAVDLSFDDESPAASADAAPADPILEESLRVLGAASELLRWSAADEAAFRKDLDAMFEGARADALAVAERSGRAQLESVPALLEREQFDLACRSLEATMCVPAVRFEAASLLAQIRCHCGDPLNALSILLWASEYPPPAETAVAHDFAYQLGAVFETLGMRKEALDIFRELVGEAGPEYRDVSDRIERLKGT